jgi:hypothetical protein
MVMGASEARLRAGLILRGDYEPECAWKFLQVKSSTAGLADALPGAAQYMR